MRRLYPPGSGYNRLIKVSIPTTPLNVRSTMGRQCVTSSRVKRTAQFSDKRNLADGLLLGVKMKNNVMSFGDVLGRVERRTRVLNDLFEVSA
jgi:hypothetical protein